MMKERYQRNALLLGEDYLKRLEGKTVCVFGLGGVGGSCADALCRAGISHFVLVDDDEVNESNINRQTIASYATLGQKKVDAMEAHLKALNPDVIIEKHACFYLPENADEFDFSSYDYVVDCIDTVTAKIDLVIRCKKAGTKVISAMGCGNRLDPKALVCKDLFQTSGDPLAKIMRQKLRKQGIASLKVVCSEEPPIEPKAVLEGDPSKPRRSIPGSSPFVPPVAGIALAYEVIKDLLQ